MTPPRAASGAAARGAPPGGGAPGAALRPAELRVAALWLACYERLAGAAAHEVNNALNGAAMNLEVVRLRARPGADAGAVAAFAASAGSEHEATIALVGALVALGRAPRPGGGDVADVLGHAATLYAPLLRHHGATLHVEGAGAPAPTAAPARAVRLAVCAALEAALAAARAAATDGAAAGAGGAPDVGDPAGGLRCKLLVAGSATLVVTPWPAARPVALPDDTRAALADVGIVPTPGSDGLRVVFSPA